MRQCAVLCSRSAPYITLGVMSETASVLWPSPAALLWPLLFPVLVFAGTSLYLFAGNVLYAHGTSSYLLLLAVFWGALACVWELIAVPICAYKLARNAALRTPVNLLAVSLSALYLVGSALVARELSAEAARALPSQSSNGAQPFVAPDGLQRASPASVRG
jgi:hypothetical protein